MYTLLGRKWLSGPSLLGNKLFWDRPTFLKLRPNMMEQPIKRKIISPAGFIVYVRSTWYSLPFKVCGWLRSSGGGCPLKSTSRSNGVPSKFQLPLIEKYIFHLDDESFGKSWRSQILLISFIQSCSSFGTYWAHGPISVVVNLFEKIKFDK